MSTVLMFIVGKIIQPIVAGITQGYLTFKRKKKDDEKIAEIVPTNTSTVNKFNEWVSKHRNK